MMRQALLAAALLVANCVAGPLPSNESLWSGAGAGGRPECADVQCTVRAGCKALHRTDACCPLYQCECSLDGRQYANGDKLVHPGDPCRVCYCQGGEVVCRRIACFRRDDCRPRAVPGRCCPEYDNCPLTGGTAVVAAAEDTSGVAPPPPPPHDPPKQQITIKEITPVSEIPAFQDTKAKEPVGEASSRAPLLVREVDTFDAGADNEPPEQEHNPAFPPLPDDLTHREEDVPDQQPDSEPSPSPPPPDTTTHAALKASPMLNLRAAIPTDILNLPSSVHEDINGELDDTTESVTTTLSETIHQIANEQKPTHEIKVIEDNTLTPSSAVPAALETDAVTIMQVSSSTNLNHPPAPSFPGSTLLTTRPNDQQGDISQTSAIPTHTLQSNARETTTSQPPITPRQPPTTPTTPSQPPTTPSQPPTTPSQPPTTPSQPAITPSQPPTTPSQSPTTPSQPPTTPSQPPITIIQTPIPSAPPTSASPTTPSQSPEIPNPPPNTSSQSPKILNPPPNAPSQSPTSVQPSSSLSTERQRNAADTDQPHTDGPVPNRFTSGSPYDQGLRTDSDITEPPSSSPITIQYDSTRQVTVSTKRLASTPLKSIPPITEQPTTNQPGTTSTDQLRTEEANTNSTTQANTIQSNIRELTSTSYLSTSQPSIDQPKNKRFNICIDSLISEKTMCFMQEATTIQPSTNQYKTIQTSTNPYTNEDENNTIQPSTDQYTTEEVKVLQTSMNRNTNEEINTNQPSTNRHTNSELNTNQPSTEQPVPRSTSLLSVNQTGTNTPTSEEPSTNQPASASTKTSTHSPQPTSTARAHPAPREDASTGSSTAGGGGVLGELIDLVGDVAAIGQREPELQDPPAAEPTTESPAIIDGDGARPPAPPPPPAPGDIEIITSSYVPTISRRPGPSKLQYAH